MQKNKAIIVSNRLPIKVSLADNQINCKQSEGGLATGLSSIYENSNSIWIGWPGITSDDQSLQERISRHLEKQRLFTVTLSAKEITEFYEGFSNEALWPLFHYFASYSKFDVTCWETYVSVNQKFADAVISQAQDGDTIWIHDYHLLLVPGMIRSKLPGAIIGFFQHIPFPAYELFSLLPWRKELLQGLMGADLIGFHTQNDVQHFMSCAEKVLTEAFVFSDKENRIMLENRNTTIAAFPMGIDYEKYHSRSQSLSTEKSRKKILSFVGDKKMLISVDRLDYSKGILHRLKAFKRFLELYPEFHEKIVFFQLIVPSRDLIDQYALLYEDINRLVGEINARFSTLDWQPICYQYKSLSNDMLSALYALADVAMITPLRDGMNLVSKEFVASKVNSCGVLILSEFAGAAKELTEAVIVNPNDQEGMVKAIYQSLVMPLDEQQRRLHIMQQILSAGNVYQWVNGFMVKLNNMRHAQRLRPLLSQAV